MTTKKETTTKTRAVKKTEPKIEKPMTVGDIPQELLAQITAQVTAQLMANMSIPAVQTEKIEQPKIENIKYTKTYLHKIKEEEVEVRSVFNGELTFKSPKSGITYKWLEKGATEVLTIGEILAMETLSKKYLHNPWVIIDDERINEAFNTKNLYETMLELEDLDTFLENDISYISQTLNKLPADFKKYFRNEISMKIQNREIRDYMVVEELRELLKIPR